MSKGFSSEAQPEIETIVFDLGGVLVDWNPRYLYRQIFTDETEMETFLREVCHGEWNEKQDAGRPFAQAIEELSGLHPAQASCIQAYFERWTEMIKGEISGTVRILERLHAQGRHQLLALSNWSAETFPLVRSRFLFLDLFEAILLSGEEKLIKPDPRFFALLTSRHGVRPERALFIDDAEKNIAAADSLGFKTIRFISPQELETRLLEMGIF